MLVLIAGCAHAPPSAAETEAEATPIEGGKLQLGEDGTPPSRKSCRLKGPRLSERDRPNGKLVVDYQVSVDGKVSDVAVEGDATERAIKAVRRYLESCTYAPATKGGKPVAVRWKGELSFSARAPASR